MIARTLLLLLMALGGLASASAQELAPTFSFQGITRQFVAVRPARQSGPVPLVIALHGANQSIADLRLWWTLDAVAEREGFAIAYPIAVGGRWSYDDSRPIQLPGGGGTVDDVGFLMAVIDKLTAERTADPARVFVAGISNGGLMAWTLACRSAERIAAAAPMISGMIESQAETCKPARLVPLMVLAGTSDLFQSYDGGMGNGFRLMSIPESLEFWRKLRGCGASQIKEARRRDLADPTRAVIVEWANCQSPSPMRFYRIEGGGHSLPSFAPLLPQQTLPFGGRSRAVETAEELWNFFRSATP